MLLAGTNCVRAQSVPLRERSFAKQKTEVEQALKDLQAYSGQKLPILDGLSRLATKSLEHI